MFNPYAGMNAQMFAGAGMQQGGFNAMQMGAQAGAIGKPQVAGRPQPSANPQKAGGQKSPFANAIVPVAAKRARNAANMSAGALPAPESCTGELRFADAASAQQALTLSGTDVGGQFITVELDARSKDGTKVNVKSLPTTVTKEDLKEFFGNCGTVAFANVKVGKPAVGQVRFGTAEQAQAAIALNGSVIDGYQIQVHVHAGSKDGTKLQVLNLPPHFEWQDLKDHFSAMGTTPNFAETSAAQGTQTAEVRFGTAQEAQQAIATLNMSWLGGGQLHVSADQTSLDGCKLTITEVPHGVEWQELKDHFAQIGTVAFAGIVGKGKEGGKGGGGGQKMMQGKGCFGGGNMAMNQMAMQQQQMAMQQQQMAMKKQQAMGQQAQGGLVMDANGVFVAAGGAGMAGAGGAKAGAQGNTFAAGFAAAQAAMMGKGGCGFGGGCCAGGKGGGGFGGGCGAGAGAGGGRAEVRMENAMVAQAAVQGLNGSVLMGMPITVALDMSSQDGTKIVVGGCAPGVSWQELKDHFGQAGKVCFAAMK